MNLPTLHYRRKRYDLIQLCKTVYGFEDIHPGKFVEFRALTPLFGNGAGAFRIGKNSVVLIKLGKNTKFYALKFLLLY